MLGVITGNSIEPLQNHCRLLRIPKPVFGINENNYLLEPILTAFITLSMSSSLTLSKPFLQQVDISLLKSSQKLLNSFNADF